jgi:chromosome segregation ATPase
VGRARVRDPFDEGGRTPAVNEDRLREENERLGDQLRKDAEALERLRLELEELRHQREYEQRQAAARHDAVLQRAEAAETRVAELDAEIREGILGRLRGLCKGVRGTLQAHWPGAGGR